MSQPQGYVDPAYLQAAAQAASHLQDRTYELMRVGETSQVLDVGCGPGIATIALASRVGLTGRVVGVDFDGRMVAEAKQKAKQAGLLHVHHFVADAGALPFQSGSFDASRSERVFQHLRHAEGALGEMVRVTRPGGWVVVADTDWATLSIDSDEDDIERKLSRFKAEHTLANGYSGRRLYRLFGREHLGDLTVEVFSSHTRSYPLARYLAQLDLVEEQALVAGVVTRAEVERWREGLERSDEEGVFFGSLMVAVVAGRKP